MTAAGWYPDPAGGFDHRYWDGAGWTSHVATRGETSTDVLEDASLPPPPPRAAGPPGSADEWGSISRTRGVRRTNGFAIASLVVGCLSIVGSLIVVGAVGGVLAVVLGVVARGQLRRHGDGEEGAGIALAGIICGSFAIAVGVLVVLGLFVFLQGELDVIYGPGMPMFET